MITAETQEQREVDGADYTVKRKQEPASTMEAMPAFKKSNSLTKMTAVNAHGIPVYAIEGAMNKYHKFKTAQSKFEVRVKSETYMLMDNLEADVMEIFTWVNDAAKQALLKNEVLVNFDGEQKSVKFLEEDAEWITVYVTIPEKYTTDIGKTKRVVDKWIEWCLDARAPWTISYVFDYPEREDESIFQYKIPAKDGIADKLKKGKQSLTIGSNILKVDIVEANRYPLYKSKNYYDQHFQ